MYRTEKFKKVNKNLKFERKQKMKKTMTILAILVIICVTSFSAYADVYVRGYSRGNGTYVQPHYRSNPDGNRYNNWSTYPNVNPYTGRMGTKHLSNTNDFDIPSNQRPSTMPYLPSGIHGQDSSWSQPTPLSIKSSGFGSISRISR
jgi:hypothetical protein